eukprot:jgi/Ulvmu1/9822/UM056_0063.1
MAHLTENAIPRLIELHNGRNAAAISGYRPIVQVIEKRLANGATRTKITLSDGHKLNVAVLVTQAEENATAVQLKTNDIISLDEWTVQKVTPKAAATQSVKEQYVIVIVQFSIVDRCDRRIGEPVKYSESSHENIAPAQQSGAPMQQGNANSMYGAPSAHGAPPAGAYGQPANGAYGQPPAGSYGQPPGGAYGQPSGGAYGQAPGGAYGQPLQQQPQQQQPQPMAATSMYGAPGGAYGQPAGTYGQPNPQQNALANQRGALPASLAVQPRYDQNRGVSMHNSASTQITPIKDISPYSARWTIRGRCSLKSELRRYNKNGKAGCVFNFDLLDKSGEVRIVAFGDTAEKFEPRVQMGSFFELSKASARTMDTGKRKWNQTGHDCEVYLDDNSQLTEIQEGAPDVPRIHLNPVKLAEVEALPIETFVDVIAVLDSCQDLGLIQRRDGSEGKKRSLVVRDDSSRSIEVTLWGEKAESPGAALFEAARSNQHPVLVIKSARIGEFNGKNLSTVGSSMILIDDVNVPGVPEMQRWFTEGGAAQPAQALSRTGGGRSDRRATASIISGENLGSGGVTAWVKTVGVLSGVVNNAALTYPACRLDFNGRQCNKKVAPADDDTGLFYCSRCAQSCEPMYRYLLTVRFLDFTGELAEVSAFGDTGDAVMGMTADEAHQNLEGDNVDAFETWVTQRVSWRPRVLKIKCQEDTYNDNVRVKLTLQSCEDIDFAADSMKLCEMIDDLTHGRPVKAMQPPPPKQGGFGAGSPGFGGAPGGMQAPGMFGGGAPGAMAGHPMAGGGFPGSSMGGPVGGAGFVPQSQGQWNMHGGGGVPPQGQFQQGQQFQGAYNQGGQQFQGTQQYGAPYQGMPQQGMQPGMNGMAPPNMSFIDQPSYGQR